MKYWTIQSYKWSCTYYSMYPKIDKKFYLHGNNLGEFYYVLISKKVFEKLRNQFNPRAREKFIRQFKNKNEDAVRQFFFAML